VFTENPAAPRRLGRRIGLEWPARPLQFAAAAALIAVLAGLLVGGRLLANSGNVSPASASDQAAIATLEERPINQTTMPTDGYTCPTSSATAIYPYGSSGTAVAAGGTGPVYVLPDPHNRAWDFFTGPSVKGPVLIRPAWALSVIPAQGRQFAGRTDIGFDGRYAYGPILTTIRRAGEPVTVHTQGLLPSTRPRSNPAASAGWGIYPVSMGSAASSGCGALQIDTLAGTETIVISW
jgi:hypothetical protein